MMPRFIKRELAVVLLVILTTSHLEATPPTPEWIFYEDQAVTDGIEHVRPLYKRAIATYEAVLKEFATLAPNDKQAVRRRRTPADGICAFVNSWAQCERRALSKGRPLHPAFERDVWRPMLDAVRSAVRNYDLLVKEITNAKAEALPEQRNEYARMEELTRTIPYERDRCLYSLAHLAKAANRPDWVRDIFTIGQGQLATFKSSDDFLNTDSDPEPENTRRKKLLSESIARGKRYPPPQRFPVTNAEKEAIRALLDQWGDALVARDSDKMRRLYEDPKLFDSQCADQIADSTYTAFDWSPATITYYRLDRAGPIHVNVERATVKTRATPGSETKQYTLGRDFLVVFRDGQPKIVIKGDMK